MKELHDIRYFEDIDYYPFGMGMPARSFSSGINYAYGFNSQEIEKSLQTEGSITFAEFWVYDSRLGKRWNVDPIPTSFLSPYVVMNNNPIVYNDPLGDCSTCPDGKYKIESGDTFWDLENEWGLDHGTLHELNPELNPKELKIGQTIIANTDIPINDPFTTTKTTTEYETEYIEESHNDWNATAGALVLSGGLLADDATVVAILDDIIIPFALAGGLVYDAFWGSETTYTPVSIPTTTTTTNPAPFYYVTYSKINPQTGKVYVGRTSGYGTPQQIVNARDASHQMNELGYGPAAVTSYAPATISGGYATRAADPAYWAIRGSEQTQIEYYRSRGISGNSINGISPTNPNLEKYLDAARKILTR